jgi:hypothetical protein
MLPLPVLSSTLPGDYDYVDFQIEREDWSTYELKDGVNMKGRIIVLKLARNRNAPPGEYGIQSQNIFVTFAPKEQRGPPSTPPATGQIPKDNLIPVEVVSSNEVWNNYKILKTGDRVKVKLVVTDVFRVKNQFDQTGEPYYIVTSGLMISPMPKGISQ